MIFQKQEKSAASGRRFFMGPGSLQGCFTVAVTLMRYLGTNWVVPGQNKLLTKGLKRIS
jgi:hypothetical protein